MSDILQVFSPYTNEAYEEIPLASKDEALRALEAGYGLYKNRDGWLPKPERIAILERVAQIMEGRVEELTLTAAREGGKPYVDSKVEVLRAINGVKIAIESMSGLKGEEIAMGMNASSQQRMAYTLKEPLGLVVSISAFNHPLNLIVHQTIPAVAVGCPVIIKPALTTPLSCLAFVDILREAGLPKEWCQVIVCNNDVAELLVTDERVSYFSFIGSAKVGWYLRSKLAPGTHCALEHGGAAPAIIEPDADIEDALPLLAKGGFYHAGQVCVSVQRVFAHASIAGAIAEGLVEIAEKLVVGDPLDPATEVGPLILPREVDRVEAWVEEARAGGGKILCGGKRISDTCYAPTIILDPPKDANVSTEEIFGPVVCIYTYNDRRTAIEAANGLPYGFQASVFTKNIDTALGSVKRLYAAAVMVNDHTAFRVDWMPFGGWSRSGMGVGGIPYTMGEMTHDKLMVIRSSAV